MAAALYVTGLPVDTTELHVWWIFACFGPICSNGVRVAHSLDGVCEGYAMVKFEEGWHAHCAVSALNGRRVVLRGNGVRLKGAAPVGRASQVM